MTLSGTDCCEVELLMTGKWSHQLLTVLTPFFFLTLFNVNFESSYWQFGIVKWVESETVIWLQGWHKALLQPCNSSKERWVAIVRGTIESLLLGFVDSGGDFLRHFAIGILGKPLDQLQDWRWTLWDWWWDGFCQFNVCLSQGKIRRFHLSMDWFSWKNLNFSGNHGFLPSNLGVSDGVL